MRGKKDAQISISHAISTRCVHHRRTWGNVRETDDEDLHALFHLNSLHVVVMIYNEHPLVIFVPCYSRVNRNFLWKKITTTQLDHIFKYSSSSKQWKRIFESRGFLHTWLPHKALSSAGMFTLILLRPASTKLSGDPAAAVAPASESSPKTFRKKSELTLFVSTLLSSSLRRNSSLN